MILYIIRNNSEVAVGGINYSSHITINLYHFLEGLCMRHGSSLDGRIACFKYHTYCQQKVPIIVSLSSRYILMPLMAIKNKHCILLNYYMILKVRPINSYQSEIQFLNGQNITVDCDVRVIKKQIHRVNQFIESYGANDIYYNV